MRKIRVGVLINAIYSDYSSSFISGLEKYCSKNGYILTVFPISIADIAGRYDYQYECVYDFINTSNIDVLVLATATFYGYKTAPFVFEQISKFPKMPIVSVAIPVQNLSDVVCKFEGAFSQLIEHLIDDHHCKNFLLMKANDVNAESIEREKVFRKTLAERKIKFDEKKCLKANFVYNSAVQKISEYLKDRKPDFDAIVCLNDNMAAGCMKYFSEHNIRVPEDVAVVGFDNVYESGIHRLNLTTVDQNIEEQACAAAEKAIAILKKKKYEMHTVLEASTIIRRTCGCNKVDELASKSNEDFSEETAYLNMYRQNWNQLYLLHYFLVESQTPVSLEKLYARLQYSFVLFDIPFAMMILYDDPVFNGEQKEFARPDTATLSMIYDHKQGVTLPNYRFNPNDGMIPEAYEKCSSTSRIVLELFAEEYQYGYLIITFGRFEKIFYQTVYELLAKEIVNAMNISHREDEKRRLMNQNLSLEEYSEKLHMLSYTDELTQKLNRRGFYELAQQAIKIQLDKKGSGLVIYCDMDGLKAINDTYGHDAGDRAIIYEGQVLSKIFRSSDIVGRLGGDEFVVVAPNMEKREFARIKKNITLECAKINKENKEAFELSLSVGCVEFNSENDVLENLIILADKAQYKEKRKKKKARIN